MKWFRKFQPKYSCPECSSELEDVPLSSVESFFVELLFYVLYGIAFVTIGFFVQGFGWPAWVASACALIVLIAVSIPAYKRLSLYCCSSCGMNYDYAKVKK